jgi:ATP-dependent exoDNAse (exonuclease V) beta subunit
MDRVVVTPATGKNGKGRILLVDFKTDQGEPEAIAGRYKAQIGIYARILALWSGGRHDIIGTVATVRQPALVRVC